MAEIVVIDPGHGGHDPGALAHGLRETNLTLAIASATRTALERDYDVDVRLTREQDVFVDLGERPEVANDLEAAAFVSIHINSFSNQSARGFETYRHTASGSGSASARLQAVVHGEVMDVLRRHGVADRREKTANFKVLRLARVPAILTENLFVTNAAEAALLARPAFLTEVGEAHARGIAAALELPPKPTDDVHRVTADGAHVGSYRDDANVGAAVVRAIQGGARRVVVEEIQRP